MAVATVTSKGQVTIPKEVREELGIETGTKLYFVRTRQGYVLKPASNSLMRLSGLLRDVEPVAEDEAERRMAEALAEKFRP